MVTLEPNVLRPYMCWSNPQQSRVVTSALSISIFLEESTPIMIGLFCHGGISQNTFPLRGLNPKKVN